MLRDDDVAERLYNHNTTSTLRKRQETRPPLDYGGHSTLLMGTGAPGAIGGARARSSDLDVKAEVDRMYQNIMRSLDMEAHGDGTVLADSPPTPGGGNLFTSTDELRLTPRSGDPRPRPTRYPSDVDVRNLIKPLNLNQIGSTFGSSRKSLAEGVRKTADPGPGSYYNPKTSTAHSDRGRAAAGPATPRWVKPSTPRGSNRLPVAAGMESGPNYAPPSTFNEKKPTSARGTMGNAKTERTKVKKADMPGPGSYDLAAHDRKRNQVRSPSPAGDGRKVVPFGTQAKRMPVVRHDSPGPGRYNPEQVECEGQRYSMPKAAPRPKDKAPTPGPGQYQVEKADAFERDKATRGVIPTAGREAGEWCGKKLGDHVPGPGAYEALPLESGPAFSMQLPTVDERADEKARDKVGPGPGTYCPEQADAKTGPQWTMGGKVRPQVPDVTPGPTDYVPTGLPSGEAQSGPMVTFGTAERGVVGKSERDEAAVPGPGAYDPAPVRDAVAGVVSFGTEPRLIMPTQAVDVPGPGSYVPETKFGDSGPAVTIIGKPAMLEDKSGLNPTPGPGYYDTLARSALEEGKIATSIGTAVRAPLHDNGETPNTVGPGSYQMPQLETGPQYSIGVKHPDPSDKEQDAYKANLGPGSYAIPSTQTLEAAVIGTAERFPQPSVAENNAVPGPGAYEPNMYKNAQIEQPPSAVFSQAPRTVNVPPSSTPATVGPGSYAEVASAAPTGGDIGHAVRFQVSEKDADPAHQIPGPGAYQPHSDAPDGPHVTFSSAAQRPVDRYAAEIPGPGHYATTQADALTLPTAPVAHMGSAPARPLPTLEDHDVPGPGAYQPQLSAVLPAVPGMVFPHAALHTTEVAKATDEIGPGAYNPQLQSGTGPTITFGTAPKLRADTPNDTPGVGHYHPDTGLTDDRQPSAIMMGALRTVEIADGDPSIPGPGAYQASEAATKPTPVAYGFGTGHRAQEAPTADGPGPGAYTPNDVQAHVATANFASAPHGATVVDKDTPGPGAYTPHFGAEQVGISFGTAMREALAALNGGAEGPGPGAYSPQLDAVTERVQATSFGIGARSGPTKAGEEDQPGPGHYQPGDNNAGIPTAPTYSFGTGRRPAPEGTSASDAPGPGAYQPSHPAEVSLAYSIPQARLPTEKTGADQDQTPGPGAYTANLVPPSVAGVPVFSTAPREATTKDNGVPGPGSYAPEVAPQPGETAYSFGTAQQRPMEDHKDTPGPGAYSPELFVAKQPTSVAISTGPGHENGATGGAVQPGVDAPGPGAYFVDPNSVGLDGGIMYSIPRDGRFTEKERNDSDQVPGPGAYMNILQPPSGAAISFTHAGRPDLEQKDRSTMPGPGHYDVQDENGGPAISIAPPATTESRVPTEPGPGPGQYDSQLKSSAPAISFTHTGHGTTGVTDQNIPGPGTYDLKNLGVATDAPAITFAKSGRPDQALDDAAKFPGPGTYDTHVASNAPSITLTGKPRDLEGEEAAAKPGPGHYDVGGANEGPHYSMTFSHPSKATESDGKYDAPGPGTYSLPGTLSNQGIKIPEAGRKDPTLAAANMPGPGEYDIGLGDRLVHEMGPMYSVPQGVRNEGGEDNFKNLGPGAYDLHGGVGAGVPAYSFPHAVRKGPADLTGTTIGPGEYDLHRHTISSEVAGAPEWTIPKAVPTTTGNANAPGPGQYFQPLAMDQGVTIQGKWRDGPQATGGPGPGDYYMGDYDPYRRDFATVMDFSKGGPTIRKGIVIQAGPGPGSYIGPTQFSEGGVHMYHRFPEPYVVPTPGPQDYNPSTNCLSEN